MSNNKIFFDFPSMMYPILLMRIYEFRTTVLVGVWISCRTKIEWDQNFTGKLMTKEQEDGWWEKDMGVWICWVKKNDWCINGEVGETFISRVYPLKSTYTSYLHDGINVAKQKKGKNKLHATIYPIWCRTTKPHHTIRRSNGKKTLPKKWFYFLKHITVLTCLSFFLLIYIMRECVCTFFVRPVHIK